MKVVYKVVDRDGYFGFGDFVYYIGVSLFMWKCDKILRLNHQSSVMMEKEKKILRRLGMK
jgi:hypothetical protein